ncbi:hypothetical protein ACFLSP_00285 [Bacteroidota bacterium]
MKNLFKYFILIFLVLGSCEESGKLDNFLRQAPVEPLADIIRTSVPIGHCAMVAMADQKGYPIPYETLPVSDGLSLIRILPSDDFPFVYLEEGIKEILILSLPADDEFAIISILYLSGESVSLVEQIHEIHTIPVILEEEKLKAVFASQDIYVKDSVELELHMGPAEIWIELERAEEPRPETTEAAIEQNAWIIDVDPSGTWDLFSDDVYTITGGQQDVSALSGPTSEEAGILQLAMIGTRIRPDCILAPDDGIAVLHEIDVATAQEESIEDLVLGTVFYQFISECTGQVRIPLATGNFVTSTGTKIDLGLID